MYAPCTFQQASKDAKKALKKARREEQISERKAQKAGAAGRVVATFSDLAK